MTSRTSLTLYIYNGVEHEWDFITSLKTKKKKVAAIRSSENLADTYLFANPDTSCIFISPLPIDPAFVRYAERLLDSSFTVIVPPNKTHLLSYNLAQSANCIEQICKEAKRFGNKVILKSYSSTLGIHEVAEALSKKDIRVSLPETTSKKSLSTVHYFGSKSGFRKEFNTHMPKGYVCTSPAEAVKRAEEIYAKYAGVVCKTDRGCAGEGVIILRKKKKIPSITTELQSIFKSQPYWSKFPIVVEEYIPPAMHNCPFPSIEGFIDKRGKLSLPYYCNMIVTPKGEFFGVEIHKTVLSASLARKLIAISKSIGNVYAKKGYRGTFDIDFLHDGKKLYPNESNMRTNGGTDTFITARKLIGNHFFTNRYVLSNYFSISNDQRLTFEKLLRSIDPLLYNPRHKTGVIVGSALALKQRGISFMVIAPTRNEAMKIQKKLILTIKKNKE